MMFVNGFLFTLGGLTAIPFSIFALALFIKIRKQRNPIKADGKAWREYLNQIIKDNEYAEAAVITKLLSDKSDTDKIDTPAGYKIDVQKDLVIDENAGEGISKIKVNKTFKIKKEN